MTPCAIAAPIAPAARRVPTAGARGHAHLETAAVSRSGDHDDPLRIADAPGCRTDHLNSTIETLAEESGLFVS